MQHWFIALHACFDGTAMKEILTEKIPIKLWLEKLDEAALKQARNLANLPFAFHHIAIMPDAHVGFGMPIGGVLAARDVVVPNAVGVDIGCGMTAARSSLRELNPDTLRAILNEARRRIPVGFDHRREAVPSSIMPALEITPVMAVTAREYESARHQAGTLGGGNHFIEIQRGSAHPCPRRLTLPGCRWSRPTAPRTSPPSAPNWKAKASFTPCTAPATWTKPPAPTRTSTPPSSSASTLSASSRDSISQLRVM